MSTNGRQNSALTSSDKINASSPYRYLTEVTKENPMILMKKEILMKKIKPWKWNI